MSDDFTYKKPDDNKYLDTLKKYLRKSQKHDLLNILQNAKCYISPSSSYSRKRWNAMWTEVIFHVPTEALDLIDDSIKNQLKNICDTIMPKNVGFDVMKVDFVPLIDEEEIKNTLEGDLTEIKRKLSDHKADYNLPRDILDKGQEMAEVYLYLYVVENYLRLFIKQVAISQYGKKDYFINLSISNSAKNSIRIRKQQEVRNKWMSIRGDSDLFYLDFKDLGSIIVNNWNLFKKYFPDQSWINSKIDELGDCRNLVAHNSYLGPHERDVIRVNFNSIIKQINPYLSE